MPTYEYRCDACGHEFELFQSIKASPVRKCPECGKLKVKRLISGGGGFIFKGSGFYITDYRSEGYKQAARKDSDSSKSDGGKSEAAKSEGARSDAATTSSSDKSEKKASSSKKTSAAG